MRAMGPNLALRPFANERPVRRTTLLIWLLALGLLVINVVIYQRHLSGQHEQRQVSQDLQARIAAETDSIRRLEQQLAALDLESQNERVEFLNAQIAKRTFSWSHLFDRLEEVLPAEVQLRRVSPRAADPRRVDARAGDFAPGELVAIELQGTAASDEALLQLVDNLFQHRSFLVPNLSGEDQHDDRSLGFNIQVLYLPEVEETAVVIDDPVVEEGP